MREKISLKNHKGYTLVEVLIAVAIIIIISIIAIPAVGSLKKSLTLTKYDDTARQIYLVSQNKLTTMKSTGTLGVFLDAVEKDYAAQKLTQEPQDYNDEKTDWKDLYYFTDSDTVFVNYIMGTSSVLTASMENEGHFLVELNPKTGDVYGVFYAEKAFTYDDIQELFSRAKKARKTKMLGYYGGISEFSAGEELPTEFTPTAGIVNKEDLYLNIELTGMRPFIKTQNKLLVSVTVTDESYDAAKPTEHTFTKELKGGTDFTIQKANCQIPVLLDSIEGGKNSFSNITEGKLTAGDNIHITVSVTYDDGEDIHITGNTIASTNSLFAKKEVEGDLEVQYVRHLRNLDESVYEVNKSEESKPITVTQTKPIDYDYTQWEDDARIPGNTGDNPYSADFAPLKNLKLFDGMTFDGNNNEILNFKISGGHYTGLFSKLINSHMKNMKLVNFSVTGNSYVGALTGQITGGSITNCGVYLTTRNEFNQPLPDMPERVQRYQVKGSPEDSSYVGGMVGQATQRTVTKDSFAAINVSGTASFIGGFCGRYDNGSITNSYSSGDVTGGLWYTGGFLGELNNSSISQCYSTSDVVYVLGSAGGFVGRAVNGSISDSNSYGLVKKKDGTSVVGTSGGFVGVTTSTIRNCNFLRQPNYNAAYEISPAGVKGQGFSGLKPEKGNSPSDCYPYKDELVGNSIPFKMLAREGGAIIPHYGDWPGEMKLQTSLVYYEKYATADQDGNYYGYYAETSLTDDGSAYDSGKINGWRLNTLRQEPCVEDGYALMTIYELGGFQYELNGDLPNPKRNSVKVTDSATPTAEEATKIMNRVSLVFTNIEESNIKYTISNARVYRLPFALQMTDRNTAARFYDRLEISYEGKGKKTEEYTFFYCPDFAKNAINPDISSTAADTPLNPTGDKNPISVRSPRHINALARAAYYWNTTKWTESTDIRYHFVQENDIDFELYTKEYCGKSYNLMDASSKNTYRNRPIGRPNSQAFTDPNGDTYTPSNFRNRYNGQGYKIIDYRCITTKADSYQFTGLFGEVQQATLKNIVMIASDPENESGYVISQYNDDKHPGVGALVGLVYVDIGGKDYEDGTPATVSNCSVSGYVVRYEPAGDANHPSAVGGLAGYNFGKIENSSAVNKLVTASEKAGRQNRYIGGLVGSMNGQGSITNCYAGGLVTVADTGRRSTKTNLAGICAGFENIYGAFDSSSDKRKMLIKNVYSYCNLEKNERNMRTYAVVNTEDKITLFSRSGYYLSSNVENITSLEDRTISRGMSFDELRGLSFQASGTAAASGRASADNTHPWSKDLESIAYSYPAVVVDPRKNNTTYVHYGDWSLARDSAREERLVQ